jgi:alkylation response protein AidB-like acyl-CoA dehydrogenase
MSDLSIDKTWNVVGMKGTGSNTLVADEIFIPDHRIMSVTKATKGQYLTEHSDEPLYRSAFTPVLLLVLTCAQVGMAKHALELVKGSLAKGRGIAYTFYEQAKLAPGTHLEIAKAAQLIDTAELHMMRSATVIDEAANAGVELDYETRTRVRADISTIVLRCREAVDLLLNIQGAGSFAEANPLQRVWRDLETAGRHAAVNPMIGYEVYGRASLGVEEQITDML